MKGHRYRVTLEHVAAAREGQELHAGPLVFEAINHDDLFAVVQKVKERGILPENEATNLAIGLKLLGEVVIHHRNEAFYEDIYASLAAFIGKLKSAEPVA